MAGPATAGEAQNFIVFLDNTPGAGGLEQRMRALMGSLGIAANPVMVFDQLNGFVLNITEQQAQRLRALGGVESVEADAAVFLEPPAQVIPKGGESSQLEPLSSVDASSGGSDLAIFSDGRGSSGDIVPWGVQAVWRGEDITQRGNVASDTFAFVIDSGILNSTGDLNFASDSSWHRSWVSSGPPGQRGPFSDPNGHGTHVAGTIGALVNGTGVVGVAPGANMVSLRVFDSSGGGASFATIIDAINHAVGVINTNGIDKSKAVINMSLGGSFATSLDSAVRNAANQGILFSLAAGNSGALVDNFSPAAAGGELNPNVFTVSAVDNQYRMASWSNWDDRSGNGEDNIDVAAPGVRVLSYYQNGQLAYLNGTSMAAPHVAGLLLMGGVEQGALVTPVVANTADPFALGVSSTTTNPDPEPEPETPIDESDPITDADQVLWGTTGNDTITGGNGNDRISGVLETGTSAAAMGAGQIDVLIGGGGANIFVLGDERGVFYDDRNPRNTGDGDYALIKDFTPGVDRLQLAGGSYVFTSSGGNLLLYWDQNNNGRLDTTGRDKDELIAVLEGVTSISASDVIWA